MRYHDDEKMDKFSTFSISVCKPTRSLWFKKEESKSSAKEAQTTVKSSQKKQKHLLERKRQKLLKLVPLLVQQLLHQHKRKLKHQRNQVKVTVLIKLEPQLLNLIRKQVMAVGKPLLVLWSC